MGQAELKLVKTVSANSFFWIHVAKQFYLMLEVLQSMKVEPNGSAEVTVMAKNLKEFSLITKNISSDKPH